MTRCLRRLLLYGKVSYFADAFCKVDQYARQTNVAGEYCVLYCRVTMGSPHRAAGSHVCERSPSARQSGDARSTSTQSLRRQAFHKRPQDTEHKRTTSLWCFGTTKSRYKSTQSTSYGTLQGDELIDAGVPEFAI